MCSVHMWDMTHSHVGHDSCICEIRLVEAAVKGHDVLRSYVGHDSLICGT